MTRRSCLASTLGFLAASFSKPSRAAGFNWDAPGEAICSLERRYRADAQVLVLGMAVFHREGVGGGRVAWREWNAGSRQLEFAGYSNPDRAAGLCRLGFIRELSRPAGERTSESIYFGLMTASPEESEQEARSALHSNAKEAVFSAIEGRVGPGAVETTGARFSAPVDLAKGEWTELERLARTSLDAASSRPPEFAPGRTAPPLFLQSLAESLPSPSTDTHYTYGGRLYQLSLRSSPDPKAAAAFRERGLIPEGHSVDCASGRIQRVNGGKPIDFRLWIETGGTRPIPLRIVYQPKNYLRLTFEAV